MRIIKFRGYNKKNNKWIYGYYLVNRGQHFIVEDGIAPPNNTWEDYLVEADTIGQFTGLLDKNGVEIYEGDVVSHINKTATVEWDDILTCFCIHEDRCWSSVGCCNDIVTVVGNIYDNPELVPQSSKKEQP